MLGVEIRGSSSRMGRCSSGRGKSDQRLDVTTSREESQRDSSERERETERSKERKRAPSGRSDWGGWNRGSDQTENPVKTQQGPAKPSKGQQKGKKEAQGKPKGSSPRETHCTEPENKQ
jgi:hypothetical protein